MGAGSDRQRLLEDDDNLAYGVPFAEIPQRFGYLVQPVAAVDDGGDLSRLAEFNEGRQVLRTLPDGQQPYLLASGTFDPLRLVPGDKVVVLGLVTTKTSRVEPLAQIDARLREARSTIDAERLALSPQCGFATSVAGNAITPEAQRAKLALLVRAAHDFLPAPSAA